MPPRRSALRIRPGALDSLALLPPRPATTRASCGSSRTMRAMPELD
jgi:hypothetical protein